MIMRCPPFALLENGRSPRVSSRRCRSRATARPESLVRRGAPGATATPATPGSRIRPESPKAPLLYDFDLGSAGDPSQRDRDLHLARHARVVELVSVSDSLVWGQLDVRSAERMARTGAEVRERHPVAAADACVHFVDLAGEAVRRKP